MVNYECELCNCDCHETNEIYEIRTTDCVLRNVCKDCYYDRLRLTTEYYFDFTYDAKNGDIYHTAFFFETEKEVLDYISIYKNKFDEDFAIFITNSDGSVNIFLVNSLDYTKYRKIGSCNIKFNTFIER